MKNRFTSLFALLTLFSYPLFAQVPLPYYSGFDNTSQKDGWLEYKKAASTHSHWSFSSNVAHSDPMSIGHDYSPSTGITLTDNWFVSPAFSVPSGGRLDSIWYRFSGFSIPDTEDTIAIYFLNGSQDPAMATKKLLFDFRGNDYQTSDTFLFKSGLVLPPSAGMSYIAIRYRNTDCSSKWLTCNFDDIRIGGGAVGLESVDGTLQPTVVYPNPSTGIFNVIHPSDTRFISVYNTIGQAVVQIDVTGVNNNLEINLENQPQGVYLMISSDGTNSYMQKLIVR